MSDNTAAKVLNEFGARITSIPARDRPDYIECTVCMGIALMRGGGGDEYVRDFLNAALADLDKPSETFMQPTIQ